MSDFIDLEKDDFIDLSKDPDLKKVTIRLTWEPAKRPDETFDLDVSLFCCKNHPGTGDPRLMSNSHFVFFKNKTSPDGAIFHSGDDLVGLQGEEVFVDLTKLDPRLDEVAIFATIFKGAERGQYFSRIPKAALEIFNTETKELVCRYELTTKFTGQETAVQFGSLMNRGDHWDFVALGNGHECGLIDIVEGYGGGVKKSA